MKLKWRTQGSRRVLAPPGAGPRCGPPLCPSGADSGFSSELTVDDSYSQISSLCSEWLSFSITKGKAVFRSLIMVFNLDPSGLYITFISCELSVCVHHVCLGLCCLL